MDTTKNEARTAGVLYLLPVLPAQIGEVVSTVCLLGVGARRRPGRSRALAVQGAGP